MFPLAKQHNLRIIVPNLRDYPGSTPYTQAELALLLSKDPSNQRIAVCALGQELATFLRNIVTVENLPPVRTVSGRKENGLALLGWSLGSVWTLSMLGNEESMDDETKKVLRRSMRTLVLHGA